MITVVASRNSQLSLNQDSNLLDVKIEDKIEIEDFRRNSAMPFLQKDDQYETDNIISSISEEETDKTGVTIKHEINVTPTIIANFKDKNSLFQKLLNIRNENEDLRHSYRKDSKEAKHRSKFFVC